MFFLYNFWFIQFIGAVALVFVVLAWSAKTRRNILLLQSVNSVLFIIHFFLLSAFAGAAMSVVTLGRNFVFVQKDEKKWASHPIWFYFFTLVSIGVLIVFWKGIITVLPVLGVIVGTYAISRDKPAEMRLYMLMACIIWIPYTVVVHSYSGFLGQIVGILGIGMGMYRHDREKKILHGVEYRA